ncbi:MAG: GTPase HflX [Candidatus Atribacteria bacterium]|nr:GTPase HflX [Candidatus Atribacteria bacterium]
MEEEVDIALNNQKFFIKTLGIVCSGHNSQTNLGLDGIRLELLEISRSAGFQLAEIWDVKVIHPFPHFYLGKGKVEEIKVYLQKNPDIHGVIIDTEISPSQQKNLEKAFHVKVYTKIALIHRIFAARARSSEGKIKVEVASLQYELSRLTGKGIEMSRLGGGIGTRGPGEQKIETERRRIKQKISQLKRELTKVNQHREVQKSLRIKRNLPIVAIVGYTNAGKSTLLNSLTCAHAYVEDRLFATLDPTARKAFLPGIGSVIFTDTVGFIREMPETLIDAFRATLDEINDADCLLEVLDASDPNYLEHHKVISQILQDMAISCRPKIIVFNKIDVVNPVPIVSRDWFDDYPVVMISAEKKIGLESLIEMISKILRNNRESLSFTVSYQNFPKIEKEIYQHGFIENIEYRNDGMVEVRCSISREATGRIRQLSFSS